MRRVTRENRTLWYKMTVLQQPERARACGSGQKANSDRRPVDPPPVVELRISEGCNEETATDITFDYNAHFFLYASLEDARVKAPGKAGLNNNPPILTGVPASGMAYLDRPNEAGYFIFPDLSVRHEGFYKLNFSLFETTKEEKDFDMEPKGGDLPPGVDWRMEIDTRPFHVFSAKKFPGLMESTSLSKTVADQGCRVRIRRDIRMRKREPKPNSDYNRQEKYAENRPVTPASKDPRGLRSRSMSNASEPHTQYVADPPRRPSVVDVPHVIPPPPPSGFEAPQASRGHLSFGDPSVPQYAAPRYVPPPPQPVQLPPMSPTGPYPTAQSPYIKPDTSNYPPSGNMSCAPSPAHSIKHEFFDRRSSVSSYAPPPSPSVHSGDYGRRDSHQYPPQNVGYVPPRALQPIQPAPPPARPDPLRINSILGCPPPALEVDTEPRLPSPMMRAGSKRKFEDVFLPSTESLVNGQRPQEPRYNYEVHANYVSHGTYNSAEGKPVTVPFNYFRM
jgi:hypothetical protein